MGLAFFCKFNAHTIVKLKCVFELHAIADALYGGVLEIE